jgi:LacI family transcriptional regulator
VSRIEDVAARAGVSIKTVSRVLNGEPHVREALQAKVRKAASDLNYRPNSAARRLAGRKSFLIALMYHNPSLAYVAAIQSGATQKCRELGYHLVVESLDERMSNFSAAANALVDVISPDGVILIPPVVDLPKLKQILNDRGTPVAQIAAGVRKGGLHIFMDDRQAGYEVTQHLIALGHRQIAMVTGPESHQAAQARYQGFRDAMTEARLADRKLVVVEGDFSMSSGFLAGQRLLTKVSRPTAIFAANDQMALGVLNAARSLDLCVPEDVSVAGFDDSPLAISSWPQLTTVRQPLVEMGAAAVQALVSGETVFIRIPHEFLARASTAAPRP